MNCDAIAIHILYDPQNSGSNFKHLNKHFSGITEKNIKWSELSGGNVLIFLIEQKVKLSYIWNQVHLHNLK